MGMTGVEPALDGLKVRCIAALLHTLKSRTGPSGHRLAPTEPAGETRSGAETLNLRPSA